MAEDPHPPDVVPGDSKQPSNQAIDDEVRSGVLHTEDDTPYVIEQENVGYRNMKGSGEWPDPDSAPEAPAPGSDPAEAAAIAHRRAEQHDREVEGTPIKDVLEADPEMGGSKSTPG